MDWLIFFVSWALWLLGMYCAYQSGKLMRNYVDSDNDGLWWRAVRLLLASVMTLVLSEAISYTATH